MRQDSKHPGISFLMAAACLVMVVALSLAGAVRTKAAGRPLPNGWYMIVSGNSDDLILDINNWNQNNGGNLEVYTKNNTSNQRFYLQYRSNGYYSIRVLHSGKYLHTSDSAVNCNVHQWEGYSHKNAQWTLEDAGNGYFYIRSRNGGYLDNSNGSTRPGNNVISYPGNRSAAQRWKFLSTSNGSDEKRTLENGWYEIQSGNNSSYVWDIEGGSLDNGANLILWTRNNGANQRVYLTYLNNGYYAIGFAHSGKFLHKQNAGLAENVHQWAGAGTGAIQTQFAIAPAGNGTYTIRAKSGNYIDNSGGRVQNGNNIITYNLNSSNAQRWRIVPKGLPASTLKITGASSPSSINKGSGFTISGFTISGTVTSNYAIRALTCGVYQSNGSVISEKTVYPNSMSYDVRKIDSYVHFGQCPAGTCIYRVRATDRRGTKTLQNVSFTVKNPGNDRIPVTRSITSFAQTDSRWRSVPYGYSDKKGTVKAYLGKGSNGNGSGCGVLALTNAIYYLNGTFVDPSVIASYSVANGYRINGVGTARGLYKSFAKNRGAGYSFAYVGETSSWSTLRNYLSTGRVAICGKPGHLMCMVNYNPNTKEYLLLDSAPSSSRGTKARGYVWGTESFMKNTVGISGGFNILKSTR